MPLHVTNAWALRVALRWGRYAAVALGMAVSAALLLFATALQTAPGRGGGFEWCAEKWPLLTLRCLFAMHAGLQRLAFRTHAHVPDSPVLRMGRSTGRGGAMEAAAEVACWEVLGDLAGGAVGVCPGFQPVGLWVMMGKAIHLAQLRHGV